MRVRKLAVLIAVAALVASVAQPVGAASPAPPAGRGHTITGVASHATRSAQHARPTHLTSLAAPSRATSDLPHGKRGSITDVSSVPIRIQPGPTAKAPGSSPAAPTASSPAQAAAPSVHLVKAGTGYGLVTGTEGLATHLSCAIRQFACDSTTYTATLTLHADADATSTFVGWSGDCSGTADCVLGAAAYVVTATFTDDYLVTATPRIQITDEGTTNMEVYRIGASPDQLADTGYYNGVELMEVRSRATFDGFQFPVADILGAAPFGNSIVAIYWDALSSRWYLASTSQDCSGHAFLNLAVSSTADALGDWTVYSTPVAGPAWTTLNIASTTNKIIVGLGQRGPAGCSNAGGGEAAVVVFDTTDLLNAPASPAVTVLHPPDAAYRTARIAVPVVATADGHAVLMQQIATTTFTQWFATITGTNGSGPVVMTLATATGLANFSAQENEPSEYGASAAYWDGRLWVSTPDSTGHISHDAISFGGGGTLSLSEGVQMLGASVLGVASDGTALFANDTTTQAAGAGLFVAAHPSADAASTYRTPVVLPLLDPTSAAVDPSDTHGIWISTSGGFMHIAYATGGPAGTGTINSGRTPTDFLRVAVAVAPATNAATTRVRLSNDPAMATYFETANYGGQLSWQLDDLSYGGSKATGTRHVYLRFGDGAGNWSAITSATIGIDASVPVTRLSGPDRYATAAAISHAGFDPGVDTVYIATGLNYPDALAGAPVAGRDGAPLLFVNTTVPAATATELTRLNPGRIVILGGTGVVSSAVETSLAAYTSGSVTRLAGADRFATARAISAASFAPGVPDVFIAYARNFPDALAAAPLAAALGEPILFSDATTLNASTIAELQRLGAGDVVILGATISDNVALQYATYTTSGQAYRIAGSNRFETAAAIASSYQFPLDEVFVASGLNFPDALSGAALAGWYLGPILYSSSSSTLPTASSSMIVALLPKQSFIFGATGAVPAGVATQLHGLLGP